VSEAETADDGVALALSESFDLVIMDIQLPGTDGMSATRLLRSHPTTERIPVLALTAHAMRGDKERILASGCDAYETKPLDYRRFLALVEQLLDPK
jgi:CheY-like chemotaxis protein